MAATTTETVYYGNEYSTLPSQDVSNYYELISTPDNANGIVKSDITVTYYYRLNLRLEGWFLNIDYSFTNQSFNYF